MTIKQFNEVIKLIEDGKSLRKSCEILKYSTASFNYMINKDENLLTQYTRAREIRAEKIFEEILEIADNTEEGVTTTQTDKGTIITTGDMIAHRRLKIDARKWMLGKMQPKKYGDKIDLTSDGEKLNNSQIINVKIVPPTESEE